jgi:DNA polymerase-3 subunit delta'
MTHSYYPWQNRHWQEVNSWIETGRLPHSLMLWGSSEIGKLDFAKVLAQRVLCSSPVESVACGQCKQCQLFTAGSHPDFMLLVPEEEGKAIKVDAIRPLAEFAGKTASQGGWRVIIVAPAEAMNTNSANALLKTLEEPGDQVLIVLVSHQPNRILPTIRSRCRLVSLPMPETATGCEWLQKASGKDMATCAAALDQAGGKPLRGLRIIESDLQERYREFTELMDRLENGQETILNAARSMVMLPHLDMVDALQRRIYGYVRSPLLQGQAKAEWVFRYLEKLSQVKRRLQSSSNPNPQLVWEEVLMDWKSVLDLAGLNTQVRDAQ